MIIIVRNLSYDAYNNKKRITSIPFDEINQLPIKDEINLDEHMLKIEKTKEIAEKLNMVHPPYADIITLRYYHELSISEISKLLNITENNASVRINRAIKAFFTINNGSLKGTINNDVSLYLDNNPNTQRHLHMFTYY